jgi:hypothetical protein
MLAMFGRTLRRYSILLLLTSVTGALQGSETKVSFPAPITVSSPQFPIDAPGSPSPGASPVPGRFIVRGSDPATLRRDGAMSGASWLVGIRGLRGLVPPVTLRPGASRRVTATRPRSGIATTSARNQEI